jgi:hypothetical protein
MTTLLRPYLLSHIKCHGVLSMIANYLFPVEFNKFTREELITLLYIIIRRGSDELNYKNIIMNVHDRHFRVKDIMHDIPLYLNFDNVELTHVLSKKISPCVLAYVNTIPNLFINYSVIIASRFGDVQYVKYALDNLNFTTYGTAIVNARKSGNMEIAKLILNHHDTPDWIKRHYTSAEQIESEQYKDGNYIGIEDKHSVFNLLKFIPCFFIVIGVQHLLYRI